MHSVSSEFLLKFKNMFVFFHFVTSYRAVGYIFSSCLASVAYWRRLFDQFFSAFQVSIKDDKFVTLYLFFSISSDCRRWNCISADTIVNIISWSSTVVFKSCQGCTYCSARIFCSRGKIKIVSVPLINIYYINTF